MDGFPFVHRETVRFNEAGRSPFSVGEVVEIGVLPSRLGTKSFELQYELRADGRLVAEAKSVLVGYDNERAQSIEVPARWRQRLTP